LRQSLIETIRVRHGALLDARLYSL